MRALIVCASPEPFASERLRAAARDQDLLMAADGGLDRMMAAGIVPHVVVGDLDSASGEALSWAGSHEVAVERHPAEKDVTDLDLAIRTARERGCTSLTVVGALGGRLDHELAALGSLMRASDLQPHLVANDHDAWVLAPGGRRAVSIGLVGACVSVLSLTPTASASSSGLAWRLDGVELEALSSRGVSNVAADETARVSVERGTILVIVHRYQ